MIFGWKLTTPKKTGEVEATAAADEPVASLPAGGVEDGLLDQRLSAREHSPAASAGVQPLTPSRAVLATSLQTMFCLLSFR